MTKIDFLRIFRDHFGTLYHYGETANPGKLSYRDLLFFYAVPLGISSALIWILDRMLTKQAVDFLATIFSIFIGLLLNLLVLIVSVMHGKPDGQKSKPRRDKLLHETFANISYAILVSVLLIVVLFLSRLVTNGWLMAASFVAFFIVGNFLLTLLMILKRVHSVFICQD